MTKSLTEKLKKGKLKDDFYYMLIDCGGGEFYYINEVYDGCPQDYADEYIKEVLAPVPSYDEYKEMDSELKELACKNDSLAMECGKLQEQIEEANHILKDVFISDAYYKSKKVQYLKKWGVK